MKTIPRLLNTTTATLALLLAAASAPAVDFHVATAQELQNALTLAAAHGESHS